MDQSTTSKPSGIPRPSRLPVAKPSVIRPSPSKDSLQAPKPSIINPRLRPSASRDQLSSPTASKVRGPATTPLRHRASANFVRDRDASTGTIVRTPPSSQKSRRISHDVLFRKPSRSTLGGDNEFDAYEGDTLIAEDRADTPRKTRPSLSERTMETLQNIPSTPAVKKRTSSFFNNENPGGSPTRSTSSRPTSSAGPTNSGPADFSSSTNTIKPYQTTMQFQTPAKRQGIERSQKTPANTRIPSSSVDVSASKLPAPKTSGRISPNSSKPAYLKTGSKIGASRPLKSRPSLNGLSRKPSVRGFNQSDESDGLGVIPKRKPTSASTAPSSNSSEATIATTTSRTSLGAASSVSSTDSREHTPRKSSLALRDQIAKAKAAKRAAISKQVSGSGLNREEVPVIPSDSFDFGLPNDPFNQNPDPNDSKRLLRKRVAAARMDGRLNIAAMGFKNIPDEVMNMYSLESIGAKDGSWAEAVDLTRFIAADNELEILSDEVFPDLDPRGNLDDDDSKGNQFGGLQSLDLHGNLLRALPMGLRRLELLTTLNLSHNKLNNDCFHVISQILSLRDLKLAGNQLIGQLDASIVNLINLEDLDLRQNSLTSIPEGISELVKLRILNISENEFKSLPFESLRQLPLIQLLAAKNQLTGTLIAEGIDELSHLQILDITANGISSLHASTGLRLPALHQLNCSANRLTSLPDMTTWLSLLTIAAEDNSIDVIPEGFVTLPKIKSVDFSGNNIKVLDDKIGGMESLEMLRISGNPLRDKKFAGMSVDDLKRALKARMEPSEVEMEKDKEQEADGAFYSAPVSPVSGRSHSRPGTSDWAVQPGGILDRSHTKSHSFNPVVAANVAAEHQIKVLQLHHNMFKEIPDSIAFFADTLTTLTLAHNELTSDTFMKDGLYLPVLKDLNLSSNTFNSLQPLIQRLQAPMLERLDISFNRLTFLPVLRTHFPHLVTLLASHNTIKELLPESIRGFKVVDLSSNDINSLNAKIGLLGGPGGLEKLDVTGNRFRVPKYTILEKGTAATLAWLKDRIPVGEVNGNEDDVD